MRWLTEFGCPVESDVPLAPLTWFRLGGPARAMVHPRSTEEMAGILRRCRDADVPVKVLGGGANVLIRDEGFAGLVVRLDQPVFREIQAAASGEANDVDVGGGVDLMPFSRDMSRRGFAGLAMMAGIPGTVGGAVRMNAGGRFGEFGDIVESATLVDANGHVESCWREELGFAYRSSQVGDRIVARARLRLQAGDPRHTQARYEECFAYKTASQPLSDKSAGCIFKNPPGDAAGRLIDAAGLKGESCGGARVSEKHGNFFVTEPGATADDMLRLIDLVCERVRAAWNVELATEVDIW